MARTTSGWQWPVDTTAIPALKSRKVLPSTSSTASPRRVWPQTDSPGHRKAKHTGDRSPESFAPLGREVACGFEAIFSAFDSFFAAGITPGSQLLAAPTRAGFGIFQNNAGF